jgi:hypothetical protein
VCVLSPCRARRYAQLCAILADHAPFFESDEGESATFRVELLNRCQVEFEDDHLDGLDAYVRAQHPTATPDEIAEAKAKQHARVLGAVRFVAELFNFGLLPGACGCECVRVEDVTLARAFVGAQSNSCSVL